MQALFLPVLLLILFQKEKEKHPGEKWYKIILNKGTAHGVEKNMAVMTPRGLIGKIVIATPYTSEVELLYTNNENYRVSALTLGKNNEEIHGLIEGYDVERNELLLKRIDSKLNVEVGGKVLSSGLGGIFPKGILIGEITEVTTDDFGLTKMAYVKPAADFSMLENVIIAKRKTIAVDGSDGNATNADLTNEPVVEDAEEDK